MSLVTVFGISAAVLFFMVLYRGIEVAMGKDIIPTQARATADKKVVRCIATTQRTVKRIKQRTLHEAKKIPVFFLYVLVHVWKWALKQTLKAVSLVQGRGDGSAQGAVASHLEAVREYEEQLRK